MKLCSFPVASRFCSTQFAEFDGLPPQRCSPVLRKSPFSGAFSSFPNLYAPKSKSSNCLLSVADLYFETHGSWRKITVHLLTNLSINVPQYTADQLHLTCNTCTIHKRFPEPIRKANSLEVHNYASLSITQLGLMRRII